MKPIVRAFPFIAVAGLFCLIMTACSHQLQPFRLLSTLEGKWVSEADKEIMMEEWSVKGDTLMVGKGSRISGTDTTLMENLEIRGVKKNISYVPQVIGQNNDQQVFFKLKTFSEKEFLFVNPEHDFPTSVSYHFLGADSMRVTISGIRMGKRRNIDFNFRRVK